MNNAFEIQRLTGQYWLDVVAALAEKDAIIAAKDLEIAKLQPGYVEPEPPTVAKKVDDAIDAALTDEEKAIYAKEIYAAVVAITSAEVAVKAQPVEEPPIADEKSSPIGKLAP